MGKKDKSEVKPRKINLGFKIPDKLQQINEPISFGFSSKGENDFQAYIKTLNGGKINLESFVRTITYDGENKERIILSQPLENTNELLNKEVYEILKYDLILVIDTSYKTINETVYASTCWLVCEKIKTDDNVYGMITYKYNWFANGEKRPENIMYANVIDKVSKFKSENNLETKVAVIVDCDLDKIEEYNKRDKPIYADFYLPEFFKLFYANSERGTSEYIENKLMKLCDSGAKEALQKFLKSENAV